MRTLLWVVALSATLFSTPTYGIDLCRCLGLDCILGCADTHACGSGCEPGCGCDVGCGADVGCCEPTCGIGAYCANGRAYAGQTWDGCCETGPRLCPCTDECGNCSSPGGCCLAGGCGDACGCGDGCGDCCEPACGCGVGCEPCCGCSPGPAGGCGAPGSCVGKGWIGCRILARIGNCFCGCSGCDGEVYWCEWHNDPPRCCDPCDHHGNWVGPGAGYHAPYDHPYSIHSAPDQMQYVNQAPTKQKSSSTVAKRPARPKTPPGRTVRRPYAGPARTAHR